MNRPARVFRAVAVIGLSFLAGYYSRRDDAPIVVAVNRPADITEIAALDCEPEKAPWPACRARVFERDGDGNVYQSFDLSMTDPVSRIFE